MRDANAPNTGRMSESLTQVVDALEQLAVPYVVVGSFASTFWGRPRTTHDADLVVEISPAQARSLARLLEERFYAPDFVLEEAARKRDQFNVIDLSRACAHYSKSSANASGINNLNSNLNYHSSS
jgi:hypothetical protein